MKLISDKLQEAWVTVPSPGNDVRLASLRDEGAERFDAAGLHYLETLARRAASHEGSVRSLLEAKLEHRLVAFAGRFAQARCDAAEVLAFACSKYPQSVAQLQRLFGSADFKGLRQLFATLEARAQCAALNELASQFELGVRGVPGTALVDRPASRTGQPGSQILELKTVRESRATWARLSVDQQLSSAMKQAPQNAGPINSHMLVLRSLAMMQSISPDYLSSMVSYVDTLLALDPGAIEAPVRRKKAPPAKTARPGKAIRK